MSYTILITGGSGLIGSYLSEELKKKGHKVNHLSRTKTGKEKFKTFLWDIKKGEIEKEAILNADAIVHLAGASVADKRWTRKRKEEILKSRTESTALLYKRLVEVPNKVKVVVGASGIGIYGENTGGTPISESSNYGDDFLAKVSEEWEASLDQISKLKIRVAKIRIGMVLAPEGGALPKLSSPIKLGLGAAMGSGKQYYSWIHIEDLTRIFMQVLENENYQGPYNAVAPNPVNNKEFTKVLASVMNRPLIVPNIPSIVLKLALGEMSSVVLGGSKVSCEKLLKEGFKFKYELLEPSLKDLLKE